MKKVKDTIAKGVILCASIMFIGGCKGTTPETDNKVPDTTMAAVKQSESESDKDVVINSEPTVPETTKLETVEESEEAETEPIKAAEVEESPKYVETYGDSVNQKLEQYVKEILMNEFGEFKSLHLEYGYEMGEMGLRPMPTGVDSGIISTHIEDMDLDGIPELMVFLANPFEGYGAGIGLNIDLYTYRIAEGTIKFVGEGRLCSNLLLSDSDRFGIFIKDFGNRKVIGASSKGWGFVSSDGTTKEINLYQISKNGDMENLKSKEDSGSDWEESKSLWADDIRQQGFEVTANEWEQSKNCDLSISVNEPGYKDLITGNIGVNVSPGDFFGWEGEVCPHKIVGDIIVHN